MKKQIQLEKMAKIFWNRDSSALDYDETLFLGEHICMVAEKRALSVCRIANVPSVLHTDNALFYILIPGR